MLKNNQHDSTIFNIKTPEFYINMKPGDIPPRGHPDRQAFVEREIHKCTKGVNINGIDIVGSLYYELNYHIIQKDLDEGGTTIGLAELRDTSWIIHNDYAEAQKQKKHYCFSGLRQSGKTVSMVSLTMREINIYENTTALLLFANSPDIATFTEKFRVAHSNLVDFLKVPLLDKDFNKSFLRFGFKETSNDNELHARMYLYNTDGGKNTEVAAGKTLSYFAMDEIAKDNFIESWNAVIPAFRGKNGFRNAGLFTFTGGNAVKSQEAERFFMNPSASNILDFNGTGRFLDGTYRADFKNIVTFADHLKEEGINIPDNSELYTIKYYKSNKDLATEILDKEYDDLLKAGDTLSANKHKMYNPRKISDMFLKENANPFSDLSVHLEQLYEYLGTQEYHTQTYKLEESGDEVIATPVDQHYDPFSTNLDQPIVILDKPRDIENNVKIYVSGLDNVNVNKTSQSASKASFYVMRKPTSNYSDPWQETMVAWYNGRKDINDLREKLRLTLKYYGASKGAITLLHEAPDDTLTQWFMDKKIGYWLEDTYQLSKQIFANTKAFSAKGLRPTTRNQDYYISKIRDYLTEEMPDGRLGLWRIKDKLLVKQLLSFDGDLGICFVKDTLVTTINGYKKIQDINIGDLVLTHTGDYKPVIKLYSKVYNGGLINVKIKGNYRDIVCTPEHPFYVKTFPYVRYTKTRHDKEKEFYLSDFKWTNAEHLTNKDYSLTAYSNYKITCPLTEEELYVLGWFITDGYMTAKKRTKICFQGDQEVIAWKIKDIIEKNERFTPVYFESTHHITGKKFTSHTKRCQPTVKKIPGKYAYSLECTSYWLSNLIDKYVITHKGGFKELIPEFVHYTNLEPFILGVFEGDGSLTNSILNGNDRYNLRISGTYINFIDQLYFILTNMKIDVGIGYNSYSDRINNNPQKNLSITNTKSINKLLKGSLKFKKIEEKEQNRTSLLDEKGLLKGIRKITRIPLKENTVVYNLEVADNNTYVVENQVVHNCDALVGFGHTLAHLYKERNYVARVSEPTEKPVSASDIAKAYSSGFGFNLPKSKKTKSMI